MLRRILSGLCVLTLTLGAISSLSAAPSDTAVQKLANFPALQKLKAPGGARVYLRQVAAAYERAGYEAFARALRQSDALFGIIGDPDAATASVFAEARRELRELKKALAENDSIVVPDQIGDRVPNYPAVAAEFVANCERALKNLSAGKEITSGLKKKPIGAWVTRSGKDVVELSRGGTGTDGGAYGSVAISGGALPTEWEFHDAGGITVCSVTTVTGGTLTDNTPDGSALSKVLLQGGSLSIPGFSSALLAMIPPATTPPDIVDCAFLTLSQDYTVNGSDFPAGTQFFKVADDYVAAGGAILLPKGPLTATPVTISE